MQGRAKPLVDLLQIFGIFAINHILKEWLSIKIFSAFSDF